MLFSERNGHSPLSSNLQPNSISTAVRNSLWNEVTEWIDTQDLGGVCYLIWKNFFKTPTDTMPLIERYAGVSYNNAWAQVREYYFSCPWHKVYSFIEFLISTDPYGPLAQKINAILIEEVSAYRIFNNHFIQITDQHELSALSEGVSYKGIFSPVSQHIQSSIDLLSSRENPDYRNSIKEAISAVEAMGKIITNQPNATLGEILKTLESKHKLHEALKKGYMNLYGYTNDANGIRHGLMEESNLTQADAKYFLLSCTSFVNYLKTFIASPKEEK
ncbi:AbiJ-NTD4 domain-containing protein [Polynucleobacter sphagniphilus]|uniref:AbiJ-NTD4 domain-containing protein n=1 Tax=Polynucleobacter sphagniphilus TaxID=1743169 RepID=UPI00240613B6|nr:hypothetical protein [Polynucleobacter sphagniphilus]MDF9789234.1 hypothetical protein [Polynucleobacter sphagniphilus]